MKAINPVTPKTSATVSAKARKNAEAKALLTVIETNNNLDAIVITPAPELQTVGEKLEAIKEVNAIKGLTEKEAKAEAKAEAEAETLLEGGINKTVERFYSNATAMNKNGKTTTGIMKLASGFNAGIFTAVPELMQLQLELLQHADKQLETLTGPALTTFKAEIKGTQKLFNKKNVQDQLLGKERTQRVYFGTLQQKDIESGKIPQEQVTAEGLEIGKHCITLVEATPTQEADVKSRLEHNEDITADQRPTLDADIDSIGAYVYDLEQTIAHLQAELKTFKC